MANVISGFYRLIDVLRLTYQYFPQRFDTRDRDVLRQIIIQQIKTLHPDRPGEPQIRYSIITRSYPQYPPYIKKGQRVQRKVRHEYDVTLEMDKLSLQTKHWRARLGSGKQWVEHPPQSQIHSIYRENLATWTKERIQQHRAKIGLYLDVGDWNSRVNGVNGDFIFRCSYIYHKFGHHFGRNYYGFAPARIMNPDNIIFFPKHLLRVIEVLMNKGILQR